MYKRLFMFICIILISSPLQAADYTKVYPGNICQAMHGTQSVDIKRHAGRGIGNYSNTLRWIVCPIIKQVVDENAHKLDAWVYLTSDYPVECQLIASDPRGNTMDQQAGFGSGDVIKIHMQTLQGHRQGTWGIQCRIGPNTILHSYVAREHVAE